MNQPYVGTRIHPPNAAEPTYSSPLDQVKQYTAKVEDLLESAFDPIKPYLLPAAGLMWQTPPRLWAVFDCCDVP
jgi:hypothetical protein